ncbi:MAG: FAD/NAD(P)-binding protein [Alphaproteobacteria bacterium]|nr:FAD/NAD(P)-binding protein [Alphaproteobacteria bacterium]
MRDPMTPSLYRVDKVVRELPDTATLGLVPSGGDGPFSFRPGQFNMLYRFGMGEVPISISGDTLDRSRVVHTIRAVGSVSRALTELAPGDEVGLRGPFGSSWPVDEAAGHDVVIVTGGIGLAPLRPAIYHVLSNRGRYGRFVILYGARTPNDILFRSELESWRSRFDVDVLVTVDSAGREWGGNVGVVTRLVDRAGFDPLHTVALVCGPEVMMRFAIPALNGRGVPNGRIHVSMERNMKCAIGLCGHCQYGSYFVCKDGPVFPFARIATLFAVREA